MTLQDRLKSNQIDIFLNVLYSIILGFLGNTFKKTGIYSLLDILLVIIFIPSFIPKKKNLITN